jgi:hypothetical protein
MITTTPSVAKADVATPSLTPTVFILSDDCARIEYDSTSFAGRASFSYKTNDTERKFSGDEIRVTKSEFGDLVTVSVGFGDAEDSTLTLLVPKITVTRDEPKATLETKAILMALRRLGPVHQHYKVLDLKGTAEFIEF